MEMPQEYSIFHIPPLSLRVHPSQHRVYLRLTHEIVLSLIEKNHAGDDPIQRLRTASIQR